MAKSSYISPSDEGFAAQLQTFKNAIPAYSVTLGVAPAAVSAQAADADYFSYVLACQQIMQNGARQWTGWKDLERRGGDLPPSGAPVAPIFPAAVPSVAPGIEARFRALVKQIKAQASYDRSADIGLEGGVIRADLLRALDAKGFADRYVTNARATKPLPSPRSTWISTPRPATSTANPSRPLR